MKLFLNKIAGFSALAALTACTFGPYFTPPVPDSQALPKSKPSSPPPPPALRKTAPPTSTGPASAISKPS